MTDTKELEKIIKNSGLKRGYIAKKLGVSYDWLNRKIRNEVPFKAYEIQVLCELLDISNPERVMCIFFKNDVEENSTEH